jgi:hypothetical protein
MLRRRKRGRVPSLQQLDRTLEPVRRALAGGRSERAVVEELATDGWDRYVAQAFVADVAATDEQVKRSPGRRRAVRQNYARLMWRGAVTAGLWAVVVAVLYHWLPGSARKGFLFAWSLPMLYWVGVVVWGLVGWLRLREGGGDR